MTSADAQTGTNSDTLHRRGLMFILSSPSGAGKTTIARKLLSSDAEIKLSVSATTRPPREGEEDGVHYHFVSDTDFDRMVDEDDFTNGRTYSAIATARPRVISGTR